jgi:hypothetical protein
MVGWTRGFLTSALVRVELSDSRTGRFISVRYPLYIIMLGDGGRRAGLDTQPLASSYVDGNISAPISLRYILILYSHLYLDLIYCFYSHVFPTKSLMPCPFFYLTLRYWVISEQSAYSYLTLFPKFKYIDDLISEMMKAVVMNYSLLWHVGCGLKLFLRTKKGGGGTNSMVWVRERTIPTERPPLVGEVIAKFADRGWHVVSATDPYGRIHGFLDRSRYFSIK